LAGFGSSAADADEHPRTTDRKAQAMTIKAINPATGETFASYQEPRRPDAPGGEGVA
jgi:hypothetical protein